jgi:quercetin dioxygenase-like cupin family protein
MNNEPTVVKEDEAKVYMCGDELVKEYVSTEKIFFCLSIMQPGQRAPHDPGHPHSHELLYVVKGSIVVHFPITDRELYKEAKEGEMVFIPEGIPHVLINAGNNESRVVCIIAPKP